MAHALNWTALAEPIDACSAVRRKAGTEDTPQHAGTDPVPPAATTPGPARRQDGLERASGLMQERRRRWPREATGRGLGRSTPRLTREVAPQREAILRAVLAPLLDVVDASGERGYLPPEADADLRDRVCAHILAVEVDSMSSFHRTNCFTSDISSVEVSALTLRLERQQAKARRTR